MISEKFNPNHLNLIYIKCLLPIKCMNKELNFKQHIDFLLISIEALDLYSIEKLINYYPIFDIKMQQNIHYIKSNNHIQFSKKNSILKFTKNVKLIYYIYTFILKSSLQKITSNILNESHNKINGSYSFQYFNRFTYIYNNKQNFYNGQSYHDHLNIQKIAIANLYIINKINNKTGLYILIKYLCK